MSEFAPPRFVYGESLWCDAPSFLWYCIPKNASRSLLRILTARGGRRIREIAQGVRPRTWLRDAPRPAVTFAFTRNPYDRVVSAWRNKVRGRTDADREAALFVHNPGLRPGMPLDAFVEWLGENLDERPDKHWRRQVDYLVDEHGQLCVDYVGKVESLAKDLARLAPVIGPVEALAHTNRSREAPGASAPELSARARSIIKELYREGFERFGYRP